MTINEVIALVTAGGGGAVLAKIVDAFTAGRKTADQWETFRVNTHREMSEELTELRKVIQELHAENVSLHDSVNDLKGENAAQARTMQQISQELQHARAARLLLEEQFHELKSGMDLMLAAKSPGG